MTYKLISVDFRADFGFFRKPDMNAGVHLSYNIIHKPALLGILGAIVGLEGYTENGKIPAYYQEFESLKIGIQPLNHEKGNYAKTIIKYSNTVGYANKGSNYLTEESTLIEPAYRCYILLDLDNSYRGKLYEYLGTNQADYLPYFGKNEFSASWDNFTEYEFEEAQESNADSKAILTVILKNNQTLKEQKQVEFDLFNPENLKKGFLYFERLPVGFNRTLNQYELQEFAYSTFKLKSSKLESLYFLKSTGYYVQLL